MSDFSVTNFTNVSVAEISPNTKAGFGNFSDGAYYWRVLANDSSANSSFSLANSFVIDNTAPLIFNDGTLPNNTFKNQYNVFVNVTIIETNVANITYSLFNNSALNSTYLISIIRFNGTITTSFNFTNLPSNLGYYYNVTVVDNASNSNTTEIRLLTLDNTTPTAFNLTNPSDTIETNDKTPAFNWEDTSDTNFANYTLQISSSSAFTTIQYTFVATGNQTNSSYQPDNNQTINTGTWYWRIVAYDKASNNFTSGTFSFKISSVTTDVVQGGAVGGGGGGGGNFAGPSFTPTSALVRIIEPGLLSIYSKDTIETPIIIKNNGSIPLVGIDLEAKTGTIDLSLELSKNHIDYILPGEQETITLTITSHSEPGQYEIFVTANVKEPSISSTARMFINLIGFGLGNKSLVLDKLAFVTRLFESNPVCLELEELVTQAKTAFDALQYEKATSLLDSAVGNCEQLASYKPEVNKEKPLEIIKAMRIPNIATSMVEALATIFILYLTYRYYQRRKLRMKFKR